MLLMLPVLLCMQQYYKGKGKKWEYMPVVGFAKAFQETEIAKKARGALQQPYQAPNPKCEEILIKHKYALNGMCCFAKEHICSEWCVLLC